MPKLAVATLLCELYTAVVELIVDVLFLVATALAKMLCLPAAAVLSGVFVFSSFFLGVGGVGVERR